MSRQLCALSGIIWSPVTGPPRNLIHHAAHRRVAGRYLTACHAAWAYPASIIIPLPTIIATWPSHRQGHRPRGAGCRRCVAALRRAGRRWRTRRERAPFLARLAGWFGRRWRFEHWHGDRRQPGNVDDRRIRRRGRTGAVLRNPIRPTNRPALHRSWRRCRRNPVAGVDRDDRPGDGLTTGGGTHHGIVRLVAVDRCRLIGDLETGVLEALTRRIQIQAGHARYPAAWRAVNVARIGWRQMHVAEIGGDGLHRLEPGPCGLATAVQVTAAAPPQWERTDPGGCPGVVVDVVRRRVVVGEAHESRRPMRLSGAGLALQRKGPTHLAGRAR